MKPFYTRLSKKFMRINTKNKLDLYVIGYIIIIHEEVIATTNL